MAKVLYERRDITGAPPGWRISAAGVVYKHQRPVKIEHSLGGLPTVLIPGYDGPVPAPRCWHDERDTSDDTEAKRVINSMRLLDELVCFEFHGPPPSGWLAATVIHTDGDPEDCARDNVRWATHEAYDAGFIEARRLMRVPGYYRNGAKLRRAGAMVPSESRPLNRIQFVDSSPLPGWTPTHTLRSHRRGSDEVA